MVTMQDEMVATINLMVDAFEALKTKDPQNELLKYVAIEPDKVVIKNVHSKEFYERFPPVNPNPESNFQHPIYCFILYERALKKGLMGKNPKG